MAAILTLFVCPMPLHIVIVHPCAVNGEHLFPARGFGKLRITHSPGYVEGRLAIVLPGLARLDALFSDPKRSIHIEGLVTVKNPTPVTDNGRVHPEAPQKG